MYMPNLFSSSQELPKDNYYKILGISNNASSEEIKKAYRKLSLEYHPDRNNGNKEKAEIYKNINEAYNILSVESERKKYDFSLNNKFGQELDPSILMNILLNPGDAHSFISQLDNLNLSRFPLPPGINISNPLADISFPKVPFNPFNNFQSFNKDFSQHYNSKPTTIYKNINISFLEAYKGCKLPIKITRWIIEDNIKQEQTETIYVNIPPGIDDNEIIIVPNKGNRISDSNKGNIDIKINIENNTSFERNGIDLIYKKSITLKESFCGFSFDMPYIDGREFKIQNEPGNVIPPGFRKIIQKLGFYREQEVGNLIIIFDIIYPKQLTTEQIDKLKKIL